MIFITKIILILSCHPIKSFKMIAHFTLRDEGTVYHKVQTDQGRRFPRVTGHYHYFPLLLFVILQNYYILLQFIKSLLAIKEKFRREPEFCAGTEIFHHSGLTGNLAFVKVFIRIINGDLLFNINNYYFITVMLASTQSVISVSSLA